MRRAAHAKFVQLNHPHLSLAQIHAALTYYYDHKSDLDEEIEASLRRAEELRAQAGDSPIRRRLQVRRGFGSDCPCV